MRRSAFLAAAAVLLTGCGAQAKADLGSSEPTTEASVTAVQVTEPETEAPTEASTEAPTEPDTEPETEAPTEAPTEPEEVNAQPEEANAVLENRTDPAEVAQPEDPPPATVMVLDVPYYSQAEMPTGCELVSTSMLLAYYGYDISAFDLVNEGYVGTSILVEDKNRKGSLRGGTPDEVFVGDPFDKSGYGCYSGAIFTALDSYLADEPYSPTDLGGMSLPDICSQYIDAGTPVLVWATISMVPSFIKPENSWFVNDTDEIFSWISNEHCIVLVGYDDEYYYFNDPLKGDAIAYGRALTEQRYSELGYQAICIE
ncbi:MAG: C39 family peptidase [Ruminococcus sp.]|nr:C39 family peptidase [Ruminococcus sp.]